VRRVGLFASARLDAIAIACLGAIASCASPSGSTPSTTTVPAVGSARVPSSRPSATPAVVASDTNGGGLVPPGFGSLRQDDIAIKLQLADVLVKLIPLDESVIRTLSPDSYRALRELAESRRDAINRLLAQHGLLRGSLWYVSFYGLAPEARFSPLELTINSAGVDYRPVDLLPLTTGFGNQRLQPRETQSALYLFDGALDVNQPLTVALSTALNASWGTTLRTIERERALIRSRTAQQRGAPTP
jgi:hypothetical protein